MKEIVFKCMQNNNDIRNKKTLAHKHIGPSVHRQIDSFMTSRRGYTLGARTGAKIRPHGGPHWVYPIGVTETPAPETYQKDNTALRRFPANRHPFGAASRRFGKTVAEPDLPGPGAYDHGEETNKHVQLAGASFHGKWHSSRLGDQTFFIRVGICFLGSGPEGGDVL